MRLKLHDEREETPDSYKFPTGGVESLRTPLRRSTSAAEPGADAIQNVERAMRDAQFRFDRLRETLGLDDDPPRAA